MAESLESGIQNMLGAMPNAENITKGGAQQYQFEVAARSAGKEAAEQSMMSKAFATHDTNTPEGMSAAVTDLSKQGVSTDKIMNLQTANVKRQLEASQTKEAIAKMDKMQVETLAARNDAHYTATNDLLGAWDAIDKSSASPAAKNQLIMDKQRETIQKEVANGTISKEDAAKLPIGADATTRTFYKQLGDQSAGHKQAFDEAQKVHAEADKVRNELEGHRIENTEHVEVMGADGKPHIHEVEKTTGRLIRDLGEAPPKAGGAGGVRQNQINSTMLREGVDVAASLRAIKQVPFTTPELIHSGASKESGIIGAVFAEPTTKSLQKKLSSEDANNLASLQAGMAANIARMQSLGSGRGATQAQIDTIEKADMISTGDSIGNARFKLATVARHLRNSLSGVDPNGLSGPQLNQFNEIHGTIDDIPDPQELWKQGKPSIAEEQMVPSNTGANPGQAHGDAVDSKNPYLQ
jgi:hypothetical protein